MLIPEENGDLKLSLVDIEEEDIAELSIITDFDKIGELKYLINPSKKKLLKLLERGLFDEGDLLIKIR